MAEPDQMQIDKILLLSIVHSMVDSVKGQSFGMRIHPVSAKSKSVPRFGVDEAKLSWMP
jgi:hypothetical protein